MDILYHASPVEGIEKLEPRVSNHGLARVYFSAKRENVLVYLSNAIEKYCKETGYIHNGIWQKWASYGFGPDGKIQLEEYYPNALYDTYYGVKAYMYTVKNGDFTQPLEGIGRAFYSDVPVEVLNCEIIGNAYEEIMKAEKEGLIHIKRYEDMTDKKKAWIKSTILSEYETTTHEEYKYFLKGKFDFISG